MKIEEIKKEYQKYLKSFNEKDSKRKKQLFKEDCLNWHIEFYGIGSEQVRETMKELKKF